MGKIFRKKVHIYDCLVENTDLGESWDTHYGASLKTEIVGMAQNLTCNNNHMNARSLGSTFDGTKEKNTLPKITLSKK